MRLILKFVLPLVIAMGLVAWGIIPLVDALNLRWFTRDLESHSRLIANTMQEPLLDLMQTNSTGKVLSYLDKITHDEHLYALGFCDRLNRLRFKSKTFPTEIDCRASASLNDDRGAVMRERQGSLHVARLPVLSGNSPLGDLILVHDISVLETRSADTKKYIFLFFAALAGVVSLITVVIARISQRGLVSSIRSLVRRGDDLGKLGNVNAPELRPIARELRTLVRDLEQDRRIKDEDQITWGPKTLKDILNSDLAGDEVLVVSNREPYIHVKKGNKIEVQFPASGLVTALEPIVRACSGTWIAHGSGTADRETVDDHDHVSAPPGNPSYQIRRVWLSDEQIKGHYYGFSNEALWPLCHLAHTRPTFRTSDWESYVEVNRKFADVVIEEAKMEDPVILVQDYHFALLPKMIRDRLPKATIITFWHIPWPNPEEFGICPWRKEILEGLLGSSIMGFHTRLHCNNFNDSVDRFLEARVERETSIVSHGGELTSVQDYPISIEWPPIWLKDQAPVSECRERIRKMNNLPLDCRVGVGVDRLDYTKGIIERFRAVERFLELHPEWIGKFTFIQIAAPSRSIIGPYRDFESHVRALASEINDRFRRPGYEPICLKIKHHGPHEVFEYYRGSDLCLVTSLHDGMNLVAKEFIAARDDERGVLTLSQFTGAARELPEALLVNPYDIDQCATAIHLAVTMPENEQRDRMRSMRSQVREFNVYRWAGRMLMDAARMRQRQRLMLKIGAPDAVPRDRSVS